jgi:hypothetical protein
MTKKSFVFKNTTHTHEHYYEQVTGLEGGGGDGGGVKSTSVGGCGMAGGGEINCGLFLLAGFYRAREKNVGTLSIDTISK